MGFLQRIFKRKKKEHQEAEDWEQIVYARDEVDFHNAEERGRYVAGCLEQMAEASREIHLLTGEYGLVTGYLTDIEEIEALPEEEREETDRLAGKLQTLEKERKKYLGKENRMNDAEYYQMRKQEKEAEQGIAGMRRAEEYGELVKKDLHRLDSERHAYEYRRSELNTVMENYRGMAVIFLTALGICVVMLLVLQFGFEMKNTYAGYFLAVTAAAVSITILGVKYMDADREKQRVAKAVNKLIQLQNKVKIRYVNNRNLLDYLYMKYNTDSSAKLERRWKAYQQEKEERRQFAETEAKTEHYQKELVERLSRYRVKDPGRWILQSGALLDKREMVELRHDLIVRRQALRKQIEYNQNVSQTARDEIMDIVRKYPPYAAEILAMVERYEKEQL